MSGMVSARQRARVDVPTKPRKRAKGPLKRHHWFHIVVMVCGWIMPPIAVLIRFGVGLDLLINIICTAAAYIPGHFHNFWIQNVRNNANAKHSPKWAVRAGLVKDYNKAKLKKRGWTGRYEDDGTVVGGKSYYGQQRWENQDVIVDPLTGETRRANNSSSGSSSRPARERSSFPSPWSNDPLRDDSDDEDDAYDGPEGPEDAVRADYTGAAGRRAGGSSAGSSSRAHGAPPADGRARDPITGAIIDDDAGRAPRRSASGRSLHDQYADRYGLGSANASSSSLRRQRSRGAAAYSHADDGAGGGGAPPKKKGLGGMIKGLTGGGSSKGGANGYANGSARPANPYDDDDGIPPPGGAFGADDDLDRELQGVGRSGGGSRGGSGGSSRAAAPRDAYAPAPAAAGGSYGRSNGYANGSAGASSSSRAGGDGLNHEF